MEFEQLILPIFHVFCSEGTADLNMRFGLHSGPVTAGVLRVSQNARFQLFGDTVNTAARMESNGSPGMIHISQETANELSTLGKQGMLTPQILLFSDLWVTKISHRIACLFEYLQLGFIHEVKKLVPKEKVNYKRIG